MRVFGVTRVKNDGDKRPFQTESNFMSFGTTETVWKTLNRLSNDLHQAKKRGPPSLLEMEQLADRTWRSNMM